MEEVIVTPLNIELTKTINGITHYYFTDLVEVVTDDDNDVILINGHATPQHFELIKERCNIARLAWSGLLREDAQEDLVLA